MKVLIRSLLALWLVSMIFLAVSVRGQDDDNIDDDANAGAEDSFNAEAGGEKPLGFGLGAIAVFPKNEDRKVAAGEKVEALVVINNIEGNPEYTAVFVAGHLSPLNDYNRYYQNFSGNAYKRVLPAGQQTTIKYSFTPDVNAEPMEFSLVIRVFIQPTGDENKTFAIAAFNSTFTVGEPLGTDPKSIFTIILFAGIAFAIYYFQTGGAAAVTGASGSAGAAVRSAPIQEIEVAKGVKVDADFISKDHLAHLSSLSQRGRSGSPKK